MPPRLSVIGTGYLGATHAACMAELGFEVIGLDVDPAKIELLRTGRVPFYEPGLDEVLARNIEAGRVRFTTSFEEVAQFADVHFICVGTPQTAGAQKADMSQVFGSVTSLAPHLRPGALVVGKSTVPVGTAAELADLLAATAADGVEVAWNPEFLREGFAVEDTLHPDRLVVGVRSHERGGAPARGVRADHRRGRAVPRHGLPDRRARQGRGELLPRHEDLVHQRHGRGVRGRGRRRHPAGRRHRLRPAHRQPLPRRRPRLRRRVPAQGHPRLHGPRRRARCRGRGGLPPRGRPDQPAPPRRDRRPRPRGPRAATSAAGGSRSWARPSSRTATTSATRPRSTSRWR